MKSYSENVFTEDEQDLYRQAIGLVNRIPDLKEWRCHEVARAIGRVMNLTVMDGHYGRVEHSWLITPETNYLDVYCVGRLPQVSLIDRSSFAVPHEKCYTVSKQRKDIREEDVLQILEYISDTYGGECVQEHEVIMREVLGY